MKATLTTATVMALAGVSHMTVYAWRQGSDTRDALPTIENPSRANAVEFKPGVFKSWAKKHGVALKADPIAVAAGTVKLKPYEKKAVKKAPPSKRKARTKH